VEDAKLVAEKLGIKYEVIEISRICESITSLYLPSKKDPVAEGNVKARVRMTLLYYAANKLKRLVVGSGDRSEILIGYFTKYGDGGVDLLPLGGLYKTQVRELAKFIGVPSHIVAKPSSPRLWVGHTAEDELGLSYGSLDLILHGLIDLKMDREKVAMEVGAQLETVERVERMVEATQHKRSMPPIAEVWVP
jgi:NAD+ synthase